VQYSLQNTRVFGPHGNVKKVCPERDFSVKFHRSILGGDFSTPDTLMQHSHRPETPEIADENPASVNGEKFETYQAGGAEAICTGLH